MELAKVVEGDVINGWTVMGRIPDDPLKVSRWSVRCSCGLKGEMRHDALAHGVLPETHCRLK